MSNIHPECGDESHYSHADNAVANEALGDGVVFAEVVCVQGRWVKVACHGGAGTNN